MVNKLYSNGIVVGSKDSPMPKDIHCLQSSVVDMVIHATWVDMPMMACNRHQMVLIAASSDIRHFEQDIRHFAPDIRDWDWDSNRGLHADMEPKGTVTAAGTDFGPDNHQHLDKVPPGMDNPHSVACPSPTKNVYCID